MTDESTLTRTPPTDLHIYQGPDGFYRGTWLEREEGGEPMGIGQWSSREGSPFFLVGATRLENRRDQYVVPFPLPTVDGKPVTSLSNAWKNMVLFLAEDAEGSILDENDDRVIVATKTGTVTFTKSPVTCFDLYPGPNKQEEETE